jgi:nucleoside-diphosphate-sugar epimerase
MSNTALVTGCAGFIGSHLCETLLAKGWKVVGIDCYTDNYSRTIKEKNICRAMQDSDFCFYEADLAKAELAPFLEGVDYIFHQAGQPGVRESWGQSFDRYIDNNVLATQRLLEAARDFEIKRFVNASSSSVYGNAGNRPMTETDVPKPFSPYGVTKLAAENLCSLYHQNYRLPVISLRYFTVFGPKQRPDMAISRFIDSMMKGKPIPVYGNGHQGRDFTYIDDIIAANILAAQVPCSGEVLNIGCGRSVELIKVIGMLESILGVKAQLCFSPGQKGDVTDTLADIRKANSVLGYRPRYDFEDGLRRQVEYVTIMTENKTH